jgi:hypothetical protein
MAVPAFKTVPTISDVPPVVVNVPVPIELLLVTVSEPAFRLVPPP